MSFNSEQEEFWAKAYADDYIKKNSSFDHALGAMGWTKMIGNVSAEISNYLECGCNIGRNLEQLKKVIPTAKPSVIEISKPAFDFVTSHYPIEHAFNGAILDSRLSLNYFELVFTMGVLIHINPDQLLQNMQRIRTITRQNTFS